MMSVKETRTIAISELTVQMNADPTPASVTVNLSEMDLTVTIHCLGPVRKSGEREAVSARIMSLILMARECWHHLQCTVTWMTRAESVWQSLVMTVKAEEGSRDVKHLVVTHVTFITRERVFLSWQVSPESPRTVNSLSSMNVMVQDCG